MEIVYMNKYVYLWLIVTDSLYTLRVYKVSGEWDSSIWQAKENITGLFICRLDFWDRARLRRATRRKVNPAESGNTAKRRWWIEICHWTGHRCGTRFIKEREEDVWDSCLRPTRTLCSASTFCSRNLCALYQGRKTSFRTSLTPSSLNLRLSARTTGEFTRYSL